MDSRLWRGRFRGSRPVRRPIVNALQRQVHRDLEVSHALKLLGVDNLGMFQTLAMIGSGASQVRSLRGLDVTLRLLQRVSRPGSPFGE